MKHLLEQKQVNHKLLRRVQVAQMEERFRGLDRKTAPVRDRNVPDYRTPAYDTLQNMIERLTSKYFPVKQHDITRTVCAMCRVEFPYLSLREIRGTMYCRKCEIKL